MNKELAIELVKLAISIVIFIGACITLWELIRILYLGKNEIGWWRNGRINNKRK